MKKLIVLLLTVVMFAGLLTACGDGKEDDNSLSSTNPSQSETPSSETSNDVTNKSDFDEKDIEYQQSFEVDEDSGCREENGFSYDITID